MAKILLAEDHNATGISLKAAFERECHTVELVKNGQEALARLREFSYELIILDVMLPDLSGYEICRLYRAESGSAPVLMLTGLASIEDKEQGFGLGADDYLAKPFDMRELMMRVSALLRRSRTYEDDLIEVRGLELSSRLKLARLDGIVLDLRPKEFAMLEFFMKRQNQYFTLEELRALLWSSEADVLNDAVRKCLSRLRQKIESQDRSYIVSTKKLGYRFVGGTKEAT